MNFSGIPNQTFLGRALRLPFRLIPRNSVLPILQGRLRGKKWIVGSSSHGCWLGSYEHKKRILFEEIVEEGSCVFDIGANVGFYTLLASVMVGPRGRVLAFEPVPSNLTFLKAHLGLNGVENVDVFETAVSDREGQERFECCKDRCEGRLTANGNFVVHCVSLDGLTARSVFRAPDVIKIDVEGAELSVLRGGSRLLAAFHPTIFLATHGTELHRECVSLLRRLGYQLDAIEGESADESCELLARYTGK